MKTKLVAPLIVAPLLAMSSMAFAAEPMQLDASQMDGVTAGVFVAGADALATALGSVAAVTTTTSDAGVAVLATVPLGLGTIDIVGSTSAATSTSQSL